MKDHVNVYNIDWDIEEEDLDGCWDSVEELKLKLPQTMEFDLAIGDDEDDDDVIANHMSDLVGWLVNSFQYYKRKIK